jgi:hypothetical protein
MVSDWIKDFKGGSLGSTSLYHSTDGKYFVKKSVSSVSNREYGLVRWHSQFKRIQKYSKFFPGLFPQILRLGVTKDAYFFEMEYLQDYVTVKEFLEQESISDSQVKKIAQEVFDSASTIHSYSQLDTYPGVLDVYFAEECSQKYKDAKENEIFRDFSDFAIIIVNGEKIKSFESNLEVFQRQLRSIEPSFECLTHGNLTLENILVHKIDLNVKFIDPYDENIIDCREADFSQVRQCSKIYYGLLLDVEPVISGNSVEYKVEIPNAFEVFNQYFSELIDSKCSEYNKKLEEFLIISQFLRMLPFKTKSDNTNHAILYYAIACKLIQEFVAKYAD